MLRAVGYVRVSSQEQATHGVSVEAQIEAVRSYARLRGLELVDVLVDAAVSGGQALEERPAGSQLLALVKKRKVQAVITTKLDRLFRSAVDCLATTQAWDQTNVALHLIDMGGQTLDTSTATGRLFLTVLAGCAELERNLVAERTKAALRYKSSKGERVSRFAKIGFRHEQNHVVKDDQEQEALTMIHKLHAAGYKSSKIAGVLNERGVKARGSRWHAATVTRVLAA